MSNQNRYKRKFGLDGSNKKKAALALEHALDIRKFEIELYWKRATYFWALIAVAFAGFFSVLASEHLKNKEFFAFVIAVIGFVFTWAWFLANRGSKFWQENWENHVDMLENDTTGPLYKTTLHRPRSSSVVETLITGPAKISVSKVNQWVSFFTLFIWIMLLTFISLPFEFSKEISLIRVIILVIGIFSCFMMCYGSKTHLGPHRHKMRSRKTQIL
ncbi:hypothetical protein ACU6DW_001797 [Vibrio fluvialis]|nr:hypothetical protein [Vibrio fluvialis]